MRVQLIGYKDPLSFRVAGDSLLDVRRKVCFGARRSQRRRYHLSERHFEVGDQRQRTVANVFKLTLLYQAWPGRLGRIQPFQGLNARLLIHAHRVTPRLVSGLSFEIRVAHRLDLFLEDLGVFRGSVPPVAAQMGLQVRFLLKNAPHCEGRYW